MRQFILGANKTYPSVVPVKAGEVAFAYIKATDGKVTITSTGAEIKDVGYILTADAIGQQSIPIYKNNFKYVKSVYKAATSYSANFTIAAVTPGLTYTAILVKKGVKFNERNKYSAVVLAKDGDTPTTVAKAIAALITANKDFLGATASNSSGAVTVTGAVKGADFELVMADDLVGTTVNQTHADSAINDAEMIKDMWIKAAADAGYNSTYDDFLYRNSYPISPLRGADATDAGFTVYTISFSEPRKTKTTDVAINQIIQLAFPTSYTTTTLETILNKLSE